MKTKFFPAGRRGRSTLIDHELEPTIPAYKCSSAESALSEANSVLHQLRPKAVLTSQLKISFFNVVRRKFSIKIFIISAAFIICMSVSFTSFYIHHQARYMRHNLIAAGKLLSGILAYNSRIGVFSENDKLLQNPVEGIFQHQGVLQASIFNLELVLLKKQRALRIADAPQVCSAGSESRSKLIARLKQPNASVYRDDDSCFEFWAPVVLGSAYALGEPHAPQTDAGRTGNQIIGFVQIFLDKTILNRQIRDLLLKSILMLGAKLLEEVSQLAASETRPIDDVRSSAAYRRAMAAVLVRRVLVVAARRAGLKVDALAPAGDATGGGG